MKGTSFSLGVGVAAAGTIPGKGKTVFSALVPEGLGLALQGLDAIPVHPHCIYAYIKY